MAENTRSVKCPIVRVVHQFERRPAAPCTVGSMIRVGSIVLRVDDLQRQTEFWAAALGYLPREDPSGDFMLLRPKDGVGPNLSLDMVGSTVQVPPRIHLDLYAEDQAGEVRRLIALGATEVHWDAPASARRQPRTGNRASAKARRQQSGGRPRFNPSRGGSAPSAW